jgi:DNA processing protein
VKRFSIRDRAYPGRLRELVNPPATMTVWRALQRGIVVAIVGSRDADIGALRFTRRLAGCLAEAGVIVASGGAMGIDRAAHEGALEANGRTWLFAPCGIGLVQPKSNEDIYRRIKKSAQSSNILSVFEAEERGGLTWRYFRRNAAMAAMADEVVCVQAGIPSGALNTMKYARELGRRRWALPPHPFARPGAMAGCRLELERGALELPLEPEAFVKIVTGEAAPPAERFKPLGRPPEGDEMRVLSALTSAPRHTDEITQEVGLAAPNVATALLTLALEDVVVEGPGGFFRRN